MTDFRLTAPFDPSQMKLCVKLKHPNGLRGHRQAAYSFARADAAKELPALRAWINRHREPTDPTVDEIIASIGLARLIFEEAIQPSTPPENPNVITPGCGQIRPHPASQPIP